MADSQPACHLGQISQVPYRLELFYTVAAGHEMEFICGRQVFAFFR